MDDKNFKTTLLNGEWKLYYCKDSDFDKVGFSGTEESAKGLQNIPAQVPGNFELDFSRAGLLPEDLFFGMNILKIREYEDLHLIYVTSFKKAYDREILTFDGIDTFAEIYVNGKKVLSTDNMLIEHEVELFGEKEENELVVHIRPTVIEAKKFPKNDYTMFQDYCEDNAYVRKAPHSFGWDIMPRAISGGIWKDVYLREKKICEIKDVYFYTESIEGTTATVRASFSFDGEGEYKIKGVCKDSAFVQTGEVENGRVNCRIKIENARLWQPRNYGEPNLYDIQIRVKRIGQVCDEYEFRFGVRTVALDRTSVVDENGGGFCFFVNGQRIFVMGTNWTPLDPFHSRDKERLERTFSLVMECNCNAVRCWGGNVYESDRFFELCDENGILVWQDFAFACAFYPQDELLFKQVRKEIRAVAKRLRNHPSIALWAGDNECDLNIKYHCGKDPNKVNLLTRKVIPETLKEVDPARYFLPSSPYLDEVAYATEPYSPSEDHTWGDRSYYKGDYYSNTRCCFASEMGFAGMPNAESVKKFISQEQLWHWKDDKGFEGFDPTGKDFIQSLPKEKAKDEWLIHSTAMRTTHSCYAYQIPLVAYSARLLFGDEGDTLEQFVLKSQCTQAEAYKYNIERYRLAKWNKTGLIWWNIIEGWPSISNPVVDYYFEKKRSFEYVKRAQRPLHVAFCESENGRHKIVVCNDMQEEKSVNVTVTEALTGEKVFEGATLARANGNTVVGSVPSKESYAFYKIEFAVDGQTYLSHYVNDLRGSDIALYVKCAKEVGL